MQRAGEEGPAAPKHHRSGQQKLQPLRESGFDDLIERSRRDHVAHRIGEERQGEERAPPDPSPHVDEFGIGALVQGDRFGFEGHPAYRAGARPRLPDLRMHRTGVYRTFRDILDSIEVRLRKIHLRIRAELVEAARGAEVMVATLVSIDEAGAVHLHAHSANWGGRRTLDRIVPIAHLSVSPNWP